MIEFSAKCFVINGKTYFNTAMEITIHPIGAAHIIFWFSIIMKNKNPCMLKVAVNNSMNSDIFTLSFYTRCKTADTPNNHLHLYTCITCFIKFADHFFFLQIVQLDDDVCLLSFFCIPYFSVDKFAKTFYHVELRHQ